MGNILSKQIDGLETDNTQNIYGDTNAIGKSDLLTDLVYYLLKDRTAGVGKILGPTNADVDLLIDKTEFSI